MHTLRVVPDLRSSAVEEMPAGQALLFTSRRDDADAALLTGPAVAPFTGRRLVHALRDPDLKVAALASRVAGLGLAVSIRPLDAVVFGTSGAAANYRRAFGRALRRRPACRS